MPDIPAGYSQITTMTAAKTLAGGTLNAIPANAAYAIITPSVQAVRFRDDASAPTASVGFLLPVGSQWTVSAEALSAFQVIAVVAGAVLDVVFYKKRRYSKKPKAKKGK